MRKIATAVAVATCVACGTGWPQAVSFGPAALTPLLKGPLDIVAGDLNGDGKPDLAVADSSVATISVLLGNGDGTFAAATPVALPAGCGVAYLAIGPFASAGGADLLAVCALGNIIVLPNSGKGTFGPGIATSLPNGAWVGNLTLGDLSPAIADFNHDGHLDIVIGLLDQQALTGAWYLLPGKGDGTFAQPVPLTIVTGQALPLSVAAGDFNGDGRPDLIVNVTTISGNNPNNELLYFPGNGDGTFAAPVTTPISTSAGTILMPVDINNDGYLDLVVSGPSLIGGLYSGQSGLYTGASALTVFLGDGTGKLKQSYNETQQFYLSGAVLADVRGTGNLDLVGSIIDGNFLLDAVSVGGLEVFPNNGDGTFGTALQIPFPANVVPTALAVADFNGDGRLDLAMPALPAEGIGNFGGFDFGIDFGKLLTNVLAALPNGTLRVMLGTGAPLPPTFTDTNAASFATGPQAAGSIVTAFGSGFAGGIEVASTLPLPESLGGVTIEVADSAGKAWQAQLFYVSPSQINFAIPDSTAAGRAKIMIRYAGKLYQAYQQIVSVAPGLFAAGKYAAGSAVRTVNGTQVSTPLFNNGSPLPIDVSGGDTYLVLFGTGIRNHATPVSALVGQTSIPVAYAGPQGTYVGEDQVNVLLPASLKGAGNTPVSLVVDGHSSNVVQIVIQ